MSLIAKLEGVSKEYKVGDQRIVALDKTDLSVNLGEVLLIIGPSGSGKTTLLSLLGCVMYPSTGKLWVDDNFINDLSQNQLAQLRLDKIGFIFQNFNLLAPLTAEENVMMPLQLKGMNKKEAQKKVDEALRLVGMEDRRKNLSKELSGGQQQRIAIARALVSEPKLILCDEPTAALDKNSIHVVMEELRGLADKGKAVAIVTHDPRLKPYAHRIVEVNNGVVTETNDSSKLSS